jgi:HPt (histidine-containing phosphotransfer) domain-containing protein
MGVWLDRSLIAEIRSVGDATGRSDLFSEFVRTLQGDLAGFSAAFSACVARGDAAAAIRSAHKLKGAARQLGAQALGDLFAEIESSAKAGDYAEAKRKFDDGASLIAETLAALKLA